jgi:hypothetical protein
MRNGEERDLGTAQKAAMDYVDSVAPGNYASTTLPSEESEDDELSMDANKKTEEAS